MTQMNVSMDVTPWAAPNFIICKIGVRENCLPISEASPELVQQLVVQWMADVYKKAGMTPNWRFE